MHVNRIPSREKVTCVKAYKKGEFLVASKEEASTANEQNVITVEGEVGGQRTRVVVQTDRGINRCRRIICYKRAR